MHRRPPSRALTFMAPVLLLLAIARSGAAATLQLTWIPSSPQVNSVVTFQFSPGMTSSADHLAFNWGDGSSENLTTATCPAFTLTGVCNAVTHTYTTEGTKTVSVSGLISGVSYTGNAQVTVSGGCTAPAAPVAGFTFSPTQPTIGQTVTFTDTSTNTPTSWTWQFGDGASSTQQNPTHIFTTDGDLTVTLTATNCKGSNVATQTVHVLPQCTETEPPTAAFDWSPKGTLDFHGVQQQQPFVGQEVTFIDQSTNNPTAWDWSDFGGDGAEYTTPDPTHTWQTAGDKTVRLVASNCAGDSAELDQTVTVYPDIRPVLADFTWTTSGGGGADVVATFTAASGSDYGDPDGFQWSFGDGTTGTGLTVTHTYTCRGTYTVTLVAQRGGTASDPTAKTLTADAATCGPEALVITGAAKTPGENGTFWRTAMWIFNPAAVNSMVWLALLPEDTANSTPLEIGPFSLAPHATMVLDDVLDVFSSLLGPDDEVSKAAIRVRYQNTSDTPPVVISRTFTDVAGGGSYGQYVPGVPVGAGATPQRLWLTGLHADGTDEGFRTNIGANNLSGGATLQGATATLMDADGNTVATQSFDLPPNGYAQRSLSVLFGPDAATMGGFSVRIDVPPGGDMLAYASEIDNGTQDPVLLVAGTPPASPAWFPGVAHNPGDQGTVWRTDMQITNVDTQEHTWEVSLYPKDKPISLFRSLTLSPGQTAELDDVVGWIYGDMSTPDVSGMVSIEPALGTSVMPMARARTYNLTPDGEYGQNIPAVTAAEGASATGTNHHLLLTGMSSDDVARSNLGLVNLGSGTATFAVTLYAEDGTVLNPGGEPLTVSVGANGWNQRKLEDRWIDAYGTALGAGLEGLSAVIEVTSGGPGFAYASVIDGITGDPIFVSAQAAP